jgi:hypothetical protein
MSQEDYLINDEEARTIIESHKNTKWKKDQPKHVILCLHSCHNRMRHYLYAYLEWALYKPDKYEDTLYPTRLCIKHTDLGRMACAKPTTVNVKLNETADIIRESRIPA